MADDLQTIQDLLDSEVVVEALGFPINAKAMVAAVGDLKRLSAGEDCAAIAQAWEKLAGALGPKLMAALLSSPEWVRFCPLRAPLDDYDSSDQTQVVWIGESQKVVATAAMDGDRFVGVRFHCDRR